MTDSNYSSPSYKSSGKNCSNRIIRFISPVPVDECVVTQVQNNNFAAAAEYVAAGASKGSRSSANRAVTMKVLMRADTHKHINVIKEEDEDQKEYKCNASQVCKFLNFLTFFFFQNSIQKVRDLVRSFFSSSFFLCGRGEMDIKVTVVYTA